MATLLEVVEAIYLQFTTQWADTSVLTFEGETFDPNAVTVSWVRVSHNIAVSGQSTFGKVGNRKFNRVGLVFVEVYAPENEGVASLITLSEKALSSLEAITLSTACLMNGIIRSAPKEPGWIRRNVEIEFFYEEVK